MRTSSLLRKPFWRAKCRYRTFWTKRQASRLRTTAPSTNTSFSAGFENGPVNRDESAMRHDCGNCIHSAGILRSRQSADILRRPCRSRHSRNRVRAVRKRRRRLDFRAVQTGPSGDRFQRHEGNTRPSAGRADLLRPHLLTVLIAAAAYSISLPWIMNGLVRLQKPLAFGVRVFGRPRQPNGQIVFPFNPVLSLRKIFMNNTG